MTADDRFSKAVSQGRINSRTEDKTRKFAGALILAGTATAFALNDSVRHMYGPLTQALGAGLSVFLTGHQSL